MSICRSCGAHLLGMCRGRDGRYKAGWGVVQWFFGPPGSAEQLLGPEAALGDAGRDGEERAGGVAEVFVHGVVAGEVGLDGDEGGAWVALVGDEEQAGVEAAQAVGASTKL